jgi:hypothetical protein
VAGGQGNSLDTRITTAHISAHRASFEFVGSGGQPPLGFQCKLKRPARPARRSAKASFRSCGSPKAYGHLRPGKYRFLVRSIDASGQIDETPSHWKFHLSG